MTESVAAPSSLQPDSGVSLLEMLLALAIVAAVYAIAVPNFRKGSPATELRGLALDMTSHFRASRATAIARGRAVDVTFEMTQRVYAIGPEGGKVHWPGDVNVALTTARDTARQEGARIVFFPDGSSSGGQVALQRGGQRAVVVVEWLTGLARIEEAH